VGSDTYVTDDEVWQMVRQRAGEYIKLVGTDRDVREKELFREELRRLIERELILQDFMTKIKKNKPQVLEELKQEANRTAARQLKEFKRVNKFPTEEAFTEALKAQGMSLKGLQRQLERNAMMNIYLGQVMKDKGVKGVSLAVVQRYYDEHPDEFKVEDRLKWQDLFVAYRRFATTVEARQYAETVLKQAQGGADFVGLVKQYGHGDSALRDGEGIGTKPGEISPAELEPTLLKMSAGQLSGIVATETGFHIVKVLEREAAGVRPFDEKTQTAIRNRLAGEAQKVEYEKLIAELWWKTTVRVIELP
jgi:parvulin-like peptidyl-prolyl isomerase